MIIKLTTFWGKWFLLLYKNYPFFRKSIPFASQQISKLFQKIFVVLVKNNYKHNTAHETFYYKFWLNPIYLIRHEIHFIYPDMQHIAENIVVTEHFIFGDMKCGEILKYCYVFLYICLNENKCSFLWNSN